MIPTKVQICLNLTKNYIILRIKAFFHRLFCQFPRILRNLIDNVELRILIHLR